MLALVAAVVLSQVSMEPRSIEGPVYLSNSKPNPSFQLFPANRVGAAECTGAVPTGLKGETVTFARAGAQTCSKGDGTVVKLTANQPVVETLIGMALSDGNNGLGGAQLGMLDEAATTNFALQSEAFDNAAWGKFSSVVALPIVTADAAVAPDGTTTAERLQIPATTGSQFSIVQQGTACAVGATFQSFYVKGNGTSGNIFFNIQAPLTCGSCAYNSSTWTRCIQAATSSSGGSFTIGNDSGDSCAAPGALDVFIWGAQCESNTVPSSYIPTTTVAVARSATSWSVDNTAMTPPVPTSGGCFGADAYFSKFEADPNMGYGCGVSGNGAARVPYEARIGASDHEMRIFDGANQNSGPAIGAITYAGTKQSVWGWWQTGVGQNSNGTAWGLGTLQATYAGTIGGSALYELGHAASSCGNNPVAWLTRVRMDTDVTGNKCR